MTDDTPEASLETLFRNQVRALGGLAIKMAPTERGIPDRMAVLPGGRIHLVELKTATGVRSPIQCHWHDRMAERGVYVDVLHGREEILQWSRDRAEDRPPTKRPTRRSTR